MQVARRRYRLIPKVIGTVLLAWSALLSGQPACPNSQAWMDSALAVLSEDEALLTTERIHLADRLEMLARFHGDTCRLAEVFVIQAGALDLSGSPDSAFVKLMRANRWMTRSTCEERLKLRYYTRLGSVYLTLGEFRKADSVSTIALMLIPSGSTYVSERFSLLNNQALAHIYQDSTYLATGILRQLLRESRDAGADRYVRQTLANLGSLKGYEGDLDSARYYLLQVAGMAIREKDYKGYVSLLINLSNLDREDGQYGQALAKLDRAAMLADSIGRLEGMAEVQEARAVTFAAMNDFRKAYTYLDSFLRIREEVLDETRIQAVAEMEQRFAAERNARRIQQLEIDKLDFTVTNQRVRNARNMYLAGGALVLLMAIGLWSRLQSTRRSKVAVQKQMEVADGLLLNILPRSVAAELKQQGSARARHYDQATILFSDFQDFTLIAARRTPDELVEEVNMYFRAFDRIVQHFGLEKIKTIGDAYMCAAGIDGISHASAADAVIAGLAMQAYVEARIPYQRMRGWPDFGMRLGIHSGPVVAGIVGANKFQYDLWGDTVNTASRMENLGETGQVNISADTYELVKGDPRMQFIPRGLVDVKGKGMMPLYFVKISGDPDPVHALIREMAAEDPALRVPVPV